MTTLRDYQEPAVRYLSTRKRGLVVAPAGSGKTIIAAAAIKAVLTSKSRTEVARIGWIANTQEQCQQAKDAIAAFPEIANLATIKVRCAAAATDWSDRVALIVDECHHGPAPEWQAQINTCPGAIWGLTATPTAEGDDAYERNAAMERLFGPKAEWHYVEREAVNTRLARAKVIMLDTKWPEDLAQRIDAETERLYRIRLKRWGGDTQKLRAMVWWQKCIELGIVENQNRTIQGIERARFHMIRGASVLVLVNQVEHAKMVAESLGPGAIACYSGMGAKARRHALYDFKTGKLPCIVATSLCDEGIDLPIASVLVLVSGGRSRAKTEQRTGRVLRQFAGKEHGIIYDFLDRQHSLMGKHAQRRMETYAELGYEVTLETRLD